MSNDDIEKLSIHFIKIREIGFNGFNSQVFEASELNLKRTIAIKKILKKDLKNNYYEEAVLLNQAKHPNIVDIHYAGEGQSKDKKGDICEYVYLAMPLYKKGSLQEIITKNETTLIELFKYVFGILNGMLHIHTKGILHLDLKPDNILISDKNDALITDFGVATQFDVDQSFVKNKKSLFLFLNAPETLARKEVAIQSDIYQIGILLYLIFNKIDIKSIQKKFDFTTPENRKETSLRLKELIQNDKLYPKIFAEHIPYKVRNIILKCMKTNPNDRYRSVEEIINDFAIINTTDSRLEWSYNILNNGDKIWRRTIDYIKEECIIKNNTEISYKKYKKEKLIQEQNDIGDLNKFFDQI